MSLFDKKDKIAPLQFDESGVSIIPKGYKWCEECAALTPHIPNENNPTWWHDCVICGEHSSLAVYSCPNCGKEEEESYLEEVEVIVHLDGCHCADESKIEGYITHYFTNNLAEQILTDFRESWMQQVPDRGSYSLPRDKVWYEKNQHLKKRLQEYEKQFVCGCPRYYIYPNINQIIVNQQYVYSLDCMNAMEWDCIIRCPICGFIYEYSTGNC